VSPLVPLLLFLLLLSEEQDCEDCSPNLALVVLIVERLDGSVFLDNNLFLSTADMDDNCGDPFVSLPANDIGGVDISGCDDCGDETEDEDEDGDETEDDIRRETQSGPFKLVVALA